MDNCKIFGMFLFILFLNHVHGQTSSNIRQLYTDIFTSYQPSIVPNSDFSAPLQITISPYLMTITQFQEVEETLDVALGLIANWVDDGFSWTPSSYGNAEYIIVPHTDVWTPKFVLVNSVETYEPLAGENDIFATVYSNGTMSIAYGDVLSSKCTANIYKFPFDSQTCHLQFAVWGITSNDITIVANPMSLAFYNENSNWKLDSYSSKSIVENGYSMLILTMTIKRVPLYYVIMVALPTNMFFVLNPLVFLLPVESGERLGLAMTILLSYAIFLTMVQTSIPASSNPMSVLLIIMIVTIVISGITAGVTIYIAALYHREPHVKMNSFWKFIGTRLPWSRRHTPVRPLTKNGAKGDIISSPIETNITWQEVCHALDTLMMVILYANIFIINCAFFIAVS
ncbi:acetylcholine receptor subunit alpha-like [Mytilus trossulus]|uniref:acetylcholine receptor subunit alpha-like n=1 Tax=Mytilus trossulus TaxID=6551 RepID=UPI003005BA25